VRIHGQAQRAVLCIISRSAANVCLNVGHWLFFLFVRSWWLLALYIHIHPYSTYIVSPTTYMHLSFPMSSLFSYFCSVVVGFLSFMPGSGFRPWCNVPLTTHNIITYAPLLHTHVFLLACLAFFRLESSRPYVFTVGRLAVGLFSCVFVFTPSVRLVFFTSCDESTTE
jgi:hypothetical protein